MRKENTVPPGIKTISLSLPLKMATVNCYLVETGSGYILIDTGSSNARADLEKALESAGCQPGDLALIVLTHGDFDHTGNAAYLRKKFGAKIAMHADDSGMAERGDMFWNRSQGNVILRMISPILFGFGKSKRFKPDLYLDEGDDLDEYGLDAQVISIPGHSLGSIGILTAGGDLFCGDLLENIEKPTLNSIMDDPAAANASVEKLKSLEIRTIYPGHGQPFPMEEFLSTHEEIAPS
jgi:glyoxylase-like metal-dependent hydrolase (beta-lactamase superfamily II)